jgi:thioredoxin reductase (NADPH)
MKKYDVLILGSGPAGTTAGIYLAREGFETAIITGLTVGGQLTTTTDVENFPGFPTAIKGIKLTELMLEQAKNCGVEIIYDIINNIDFSKRPFTCSSENGETFIAKNVVICTGADAKYLGLESEKKYLGYGVSACATCDGNFFKNKITAVIGGGQTAGIEALHLSRLTAKVYIIYRKSEFSRMEKPTLEKILKTSNIESIFDSEIVEIIGQDEPKKVTGVEIVNNKTNGKTKINLDGIFVAIGREPNTAIFKNTGLQLDGNGYVVTQHDSAKTSIQGVYAAGDVSDKKFKQAVAAAGWGCVAALEIGEDSFSR